MPQEKTITPARTILSTFLFVALLTSCAAFAPASNPQLTTMTRMASTQNMLPVSSISDLSTTMGTSSVDAMSLSSSSLELSIATLDPTTILSDVLGVLIGTPVILLVPIVAALGVAGVLVWAIVAYANPEVEDDEM